MGFFGRFGMIFTIWQFLRNQEAERTCNQEREVERKAREEERRMPEELLALLQDKQERNHALAARVLELTEPSSNRVNGRDASGGGENSRGE
jgi:uncharacterized protein YlxW (UPF0749 family)